MGIFTLFSTNFNYILYPFPFLCPKIQLIRFFFDTQTPRAHTTHATYDIYFPRYPLNRPPAPSHLNLNGRLQRIWHQCLPIPAANCRHTSIWGACFNPGASFNARLGISCPKIADWVAPKIGEIEPSRFEVKMLHCEAPPPTLRPDPRRPASGVYPMERDRSPPPNQRGKGNSTPIITIFEQNMPPALPPPMPLEDFKQQSTTIGPYKTQQ